MAPKSGNDPKGKKPLIVSSPTKKRKSSIPEASSSEGDVKTLLTQILGSVDKLHQKTDLISTRLVLIEKKVREQKKKEIIFIKQWEDKEEDDNAQNEGNDEVDEDEDKEEEEGAQENDEEDEDKEKEEEEVAKEDAEDGEEEGDNNDGEETKGDAKDDGKEDDEEEEEGETEAAKEISSGTKSTIPASSKGHRYGLRSRFGTKFSNTSDNPLVLTPSPPSSPSP